MSAKRPDVMEAFNASWRVGVRSGLPGTLDVGGCLSPTPTPPPVPFDRFAFHKDRRDLSRVEGSLLGICWELALTLKEVVLFWGRDEGPNCALAFEVGDII